MDYRDAIKVVVDIEDFSQALLRTWMVSSWQATTFSTTIPTIASREETTYASFGMGGLQMRLLKGWCGRFC
jgi:hypothetical protein